MFCSLLIGVLIDKGTCKISNTSSTSVANILTAGDKNISQQVTKIFVTMLTKIFVNSEQFVHLCLLLSNHCWVLGRRFIWNSILAIILSSHSKDFVILWLESNNVSVLERFRQMAQGTWKVPDCVCLCKWIVLQEYMKSMITPYGCFELGC